MSTRATRVTKAVMVRGESYEGRRREGGRREAERGMDRGRVNGKKAEENTYHGRSSPWRNNW